MKNNLIEYNDKIRIKITDKCNLSCPFCHYEGTRTSNDIDYKEEKFRYWMKELRTVYSKVHLTGGDPTMYRKLPELCKYLKTLGYEILLTTNLLIMDDNFLKSLPYLSKINISLHSFNSEYFKQFIRAKDQATKCLGIVKSNIIKLKKLGKKISINTVISKESNQNIDEIIAFCEENDILLKLVPDWRFVEYAKMEIKNILKINGYKEFCRTKKIPGSNFRVLYKKNTYYIEYKNIIPYYLDFWCNSCLNKKNCIESFAYLRLEGNPLKFKICIERPAINDAEFKKNIWPKLKKIYKNI